jgi:hypothetical protein
MGFFSTPETYELKMIFDNFLFSWSSFTKLWEEILFLFAKILK